ncbi:response regulator transcription factor [soil metagenome]
MPDFSVLIVEDQARFRDAFMHSLTSVSDIELLGIAPDLPQGMRMFDQLKPDVLLVDLDLPGGSGIELIRHAAQTLPGCEVMVISVFGDEQHVLTSIEAGATGYLLKDSLALDLPSQLRSLRAGGSPISPLIARRLLARLAPAAGPARGGGQNGRSGHGGHGGSGGYSGQNGSNSQSAALVDEDVVALSEQESRVLQLASKGFTFDEIAQFMQVSPHTVMTYVKRVYRKLHVRSKVEAIYEARRLGWLRD